MQTFEEIVDNLPREVFFEVAKQIDEQCEHPKTYEEYKQSFVRQYKKWEVTR